VDIEHDYSASKEGLIRPVLATIINTINEAEVISRKYTVSHDPKDKQPGPDDNIAQLCDKVAQLALTRQKKTRLGKKLQWALYDKQHFDDLIKTISNLVDKLVELFLAISATQTLCVQDLEQITDSGDETQLQVIREASAHIDRPMLEAIQQVLQFNDNRYQHHILNDQAQAHYEDVFICGDQVIHNHYTSTITPIEAATLPTGNLHWNIVRPKHPYFTGRDDILLALEGETEKCSREQWRPGTVPYRDTWHGRSREERALSSSC